ncbi:MBL fold metallo-hydrolase, partial [Pseudomonas aeruginosa]
AQIAPFPPLQPARRPRATAIGAIALLDSQIAHTTGLLSLREGCPHEVRCTQMVHQDLSEGFPLFPMLSPGNGGLRPRPSALD